jgi:hypothetical protein
VELFENITAADMALQSLTKKRADGDQTVLGYCIRVGSRVWKWILEEKSGKHASDATQCSVEANGLTARKKATRAFLLCES